ncbi:hypothetical protein KEM48_013136 [Puccinia striiformis f. sp. tritici PST-130]|uniref:Flavoprotein domain-containing protein n=1 Tax=Puccinia striiformis f. sp. tritici PST-78 TaxID=1165861 RepID=A0A0L0USY6_9BASI|nr:hypothetical protein Pst134EB_012957 [Puccinia striiformis f. sp. tritici]KAI9631207.1 hypothetical protein KEM48_013136 [Puccinia striiformis f. sp. tritici PST-130]KNE90016.1 hypothetical protein, variant [Puccinia striiformis f. sp. tritici PST-78]
MEKQPKSGNLHVLIGSSGSVAAIKLPLIVKELSQYERLEVQVVTTRAALHFFQPSQLVNAEGKPVKVWTDDQEWKSWSKISDPIVHIELRRWADVIVVCPCSANTLAKISNGLCDNLLTSLIRATNPKDTPVIIFPSMNTLMYDHPLTRKQLKTVVEEIGMEVNGPISKTLACGDIGLGAMTEWKDIVDLIVTQFLTNPSKKPTAH